MLRLGTGAVILYGPQLLLARACLNTPSALKPARPATQKMLLHPGHTAWLTVLGFQ
jgi:hypothetical protein